MSCGNDDEFFNFIIDFIKVFELIVGLPAVACASLNMSFYSELAK